IRIPNATVFKSRIVNYSTNEERRYDFQIGVASDGDLEQVRDLAEQVVADLPFSLKDPAPMTWIDRIGDGAIILVVTGWIDQRKTSLARAKGEAIRMVKSAIEAEGIEVPDTTYRIQLLGGGQDTAPAPAMRKAQQVPKQQPIAAEDLENTSQASLDRLVEAERNDPETPDLLRDNGLTE
ncbi:MAG: mechanosensitive ion channel family protein, partial [Pseudomonadota bacterium]